MKRNSMTKVLALCAVLPAFALSGQNLLKNGGAEKGIENWEDSVNVKINKETPAFGNACFEMAPPDECNWAIYNCKLVGSEFIPVDETKTYRISGAFRNVGTAPLELVYFSLIPCDAQKKQIYVYEVNPYPGPGTETVLTAPCGAEDFVLKIKDGSKWKDYQYGCVAFDVDDSENFKDLPNRNISNGFGIKNVDNKGNHWEITLANACGKTYPAGTKVREHALNNNYMYPIILRDLNAADGWKKVEAEIGGTAKFGIVPQNRLWHGTAFVKVLVFVTSPVPGKLLMDDIKFEKVK